MVVVPISSIVEGCGRKRFRTARGSEERTFWWWNQDVKKAIRAKKVFKALLQNRSSSDLQSRYSNVRKAAAHVEKMSKERFWEEIWSSAEFQLFIGKQSILVDHSPIA